MEPANYLESLLLKGEFAKRIIKVLNFTEMAAVPKGENYSSDTLRWKIDVLTNDGIRRTMSFIVKNIPDNPARMEYLKDCGFFKKEIKVYRDIISRMEELMLSANDFSEPVWPKCIGFIPYKQIILEDLSIQGYAMADKKKGMTIEYAELFMGALAKFHALSVVLKDREMIDLEDYQQFLLCRRSTIFEGYCKNGLKQVAQSIKENWDPEWVKLADALSAIADVVMDVAVEGCKRDEEGFNVLCHGDAWTNNMMFKHCPFTGKVIGIKLLDFQLTHYGSYGLDLAYFFCTSTLPDVKNETDKLLKIYHKTLVSTLEQQGHPVKAPTLEEVKNELKKREPVIAILTTSFLHMMTLEKETVSELNFEDVITNPDKQVPKGSLDNENYIKRAQGNLRQFLATTELEELLIC